MTRIPLDKEPEVYNAIYQKGNDSGTIPKNVYKNSSISTGKVVSKSAVSTAIMENEHITKLNEYIHLTSEQGEGSSSLNEWREVVRRKPANKPKKNLLVGSNNNEYISVKGVPKKALLHVYRVDVGTTSEDMVKLPNGHFSQVEYEALSSINLDIYSSFEVTINDNHFKSAMNPEIWPQGLVLVIFSRNAG
ncbi:hypothetical protein JTB14_032001 [Gonioctena quinquepunctata]|nr:hypothetical protein JTB14_032001 [Gonioctena quinquepunctata]